MSAIVCGKRSIIEESSAAVGVSTKRIRFNNNNNNSSSVRFSNSLPSYHKPIDHLLLLFPHMDKQLLERALEECGDDLDLAIKSLNELQLGSAENGLGSHLSNADASQEPQGTMANNGEIPPADSPSAPDVLAMDGSDWVELFVKEMMSASNIDDARARAARALGVFEKSICTRATQEAAQSFHQENAVLKGQVESLMHGNNILKRAVQIQNERQKEFDERNQELQNLKQVLAQYQEQLRTLEVNNYALTMHLKQAQQSNSIPGRFHPDVF
ncbi:hypothetical protein ACFE04_009266 [Oxalis oulophora]